MAFDPPATCLSGCTACKVRHVSDWAGLPRHAAEIVSRVRVRRSLRRGATLFAPGDSNAGLYCVSSGIVGIRMAHENGTEALIALAFPGETLGARAFLRNSPHRTTAEALTPVDLCMIQRRDALRLTQQAPEVHMALVERCLAAMDAAQTELLHSAALSNRARLCRFLHRLCLLDHDDEACAVQLRLPVSRHDLAGMLGIQPESLSRLLGKLTDDGLVTLSGRHVMVASVAALRTEAGLEPCN